MGTAAKLVVSVLPEWSLAKNLLLKLSSGVVAATYFFLQLKVIIAPNSSLFTAGKHYGVLRRGRLSHE